MMTAGGLWLRHTLAFAAGLAVLFGAGEAGVALFAGLKGSPLVWHLVIAAVATVLAALVYALLLRTLAGTAPGRVFGGAFGLIVAGFVVMAALIYSGFVSAVEAFVICAAGVFAAGGLAAQQTAMQGPGG
ncbi:hypothetical protein ACN2XU_18330 [Primorskyibacter sp. 2E107]|uniref:hypothetical protein n=1 Tax=Primorskyibacter sp. 2E107 TaxID=3403458 RepID=UPI003AF59B4E